MKVTNGQLWAPRWLVEAIGAEYFETVIGVYPGAMSSDADMARVARMRGVRIVLFHEAGAITDQGMAHVARMPGLKLLRLRECSTLTVAGLAHLEPLVNPRSLEIIGFEIRAAGLTHLRRMTNLERLGIVGTSVDDLTPIAHMTNNLRDLDLRSSGLILDSDLEPIVGFTWLKSLNLNDTGVTPSGMATLQRSMPKLRIIP